MSKKRKGDFISEVSSPRPWSAHRRGADGRIVTLDETQDGRFKIISPENGANFQLVDGALCERIVFRTHNVKDGEQLWRFVDGVQCGKTVGLEPFVLQMEKGEHSVVAVNAVGESASVEVIVR